MLLFDALLLINGVVVARSELELFLSYSVFGPSDDNLVTSWTDDTHEVVTQRKYTEYSVRFSVRIGDRGEFFGVKWPELSLSDADSTKDLKLEAIFDKFSNIQFENDNEAFYRHVGQHPLSGENVFGSLIGSDSGKMYPQI
jgi:hypothetical protein